MPPCVLLNLCFLVTLAACQISNDPSEAKRKQELLDTGYIYVGNVDSEEPPWKNCSHQACDWDPLSQPPGAAAPVDPPLVSQMVLGDGSRFVRKEFENMREEEEGGANVENRNRKLAQVSGPFDAEMQMNGQDRRQVRNSKYPFSAIGQLDNGCTGTLVGPCHVLTAGHCVFDPQTRNWSRNLGFTPGRTGSDIWPPHGRAEYRDKQVMIGWQLLSNYSSDIGLIILDRPIGHRAGTMNFGAGHDGETVALNMAGYPNDKGNGQLWFDFCEGAYFSYSPRVVYHQCTPDNGNSGSPLWVYKRKSGFREVRGVHTGLVSDVSVFLTDPSGSGFTRQPYGVMLYKQATAVLRKWIDENKCN
ncbi:hypothetical protein BSKO_13388 [Bryopsis sp. KO-2023]|nr:hypothetical protein BSKO_13388 [Bryopsis sp. KO-2023]